MKKLFLLFAVLVGLQTANVYGDAVNCAHCPELNRFLTRMSKLPADPLNAETARQQIQLSNDGMTLISPMLRDKDYSLDTARNLILVMAKLIAYDNTEGGYPPFIQEVKNLYKKKDSVFRKALAQLFSEGLISEEQHRDFLETYDLGK